MKFKTVKLWKILSCRVLKSVLEYFSSCPRLHKSVLIYRKRFGYLRWSESQDHKLWDFDLFLKQA